MTIGMIAKLRHFVPTSVVINIYNSLISPYLTQGLVAWGNVSKNYLNKIVVLQYVSYTQKLQDILSFTMNICHFPIFLQRNIFCGMYLAPIKSPHQDMYLAPITVSFFVLRFKRCSNFNEVMGIRREVRKMESSFFRKRNVRFSVCLTCILPRFMRNAILLNR